MRFVMIAIGLLLVSTIAFAAEEQERPVCDNCGMFWDASPTRVQATIDVDAEAHEMLFECLGCLHDYIHENLSEETVLSELLILDYDSFGTDEPMMIDAFKAIYLFDTERLKGTMPPYVVAFSSEAAARDAHEELGGDMLDFAGMQKAMMEVKQAEENGKNGKEMMPGHHGHDHGSAGDDEAVWVCPCTGGCCADIESDEPGNCPRCGMELMRKEDG